MFTNRHCLAGKLVHKHCVAAGIKRHNTDVFHDFVKWETHVQCMTGQCFVLAGSIVFRGIGPCDQSTVKWDWAGSMVTYRGRDWENTVESNAERKVPNAK